jgi:CubicO group peptidase (beta-lactamase class C family)
MSDGSDQKQRASRSVRVRSGKIACEYYGSGAEDSSKWEIGSIRKSTASALLGIAIAEGRLSLDALVYIASD